MTSPFRVRGTKTYVFYFIISLKLLKQTSIFSAFAFVLDFKQGSGEHTSALSSFPFLGSKKDSKTF